MSSTQGNLQLGNHRTRTVPHNLSPSSNPLRTHHSKPTSALNAPLLSLEEARAQCELGQDYEKKGEDENAFAAYYRSATAGYCRGQTSLATCYVLGKGCKKDLKEGFKWMLLSAKQNLHARSQFNVARMYERGDGTDQDIHQAIFWYEKAKENDASLPTDEALARLRPLSVPTFRIIPDTQLTFQKELGQGGSAKVYGGLWKKSETESIPVAIKQLKNSSELEQEIAIHKNLKSPGIVELYVATTSCIVMELMQQGSLRDVLNSKKQDELTWSARIKMAVSMTTGVSYLHSQRPPIIHRDLKSYNILINSKGEAKLADFGIAIFDTETKNQGNMNDVGLHGTHSWVAPEVFQNEKQTTASDVYSLAIIFWELASLLLPYQDMHGNLALIQERVIRGLRELFDERTPGVPEGYDALTQDCWAHSPIERPAAKDILTRLAKLPVETSHVRTFFSPRTTPSTSPRTSTISSKRAKASSRMSCLGNSLVADTPLSAKHTTECMPNSLLDSLQLHAGYLSK